MKEDINVIYVSEIKETICKEGQNAGEPVLEIRVTKQEKNKHTIKQIIDILTETRKGLVYWSGDDPMIYGDQISEIIDKTKFRDHQVKTNGEILKPVLQKFSYILFIPKNTVHAENCLKFLKRFVDLYWHVVDIMIETDIDNVGKDLLGYASMLSPSDEKVKQKVWKYCIEHNLRFNPNLKGD